jgi:hypothetical protein
MGMSLCPKCRKSIIFDQCRCDEDETGLTQKETERSVKGKSGNEVC